MLTFRYSPSPEKKKTAQPTINDIQRNSKKSSNLHTKKELNKEIIILALCVFGASFFFLD